MGRWGAFELVSDTIRSMPTMTLRERMLSVIREEGCDKIPFVQYDGLAGPNEEIWALIGRDNMGLLKWSKIYRFEHPHCYFEVKGIKKGNLSGFLTTLHTPKGNLTEIRYFEPVYNSSHIEKHFIKEIRDYEIFMEYLKDIIVYEDIERFSRDEAELGDDGIAMVTMERTPFQQLWIQWVSLEDLCIHIADYPELVEECINLLFDIHYKTFEVVEKASRKVPIAFVNFPDNITAYAIGERNFTRYCVPLYNTLAEILSNKDIPIAVHMDGDLRPLWNIIKETKVRILDSFTPTPDNDTNVLDAVTLWPDKVLFINFPSSLHIAEPEVIYKESKKILEEGGHTGRIWIQISENVPPGVWKKSFPQIVKAIEEFRSSRVS